MNTMNEFDETFAQDPAPIEVATTTRKKPGPKPKSAAGKIASGADLAKTIESTSVEKSYWYWIGLTADCPVGYITVGGECFTKTEEDVKPDGNGGTSRAPVAGSLVKMTREKMLRMAERLPRTIIRFLEGEEDTTARMAPESHRVKRPPRAQVITIPSAAQNDAARAAGRATRQYRAIEGDKPAAKFMYCHLVENQGNPYRGREYQTLDQTGLEWPED